MSDNRDESTSEGFRNGPGECDPRRRFGKLNEAVQTIDQVLIIDNYDSFVHNLARYIRQLGVATLIHRNDELTIEQIRALAPKAIIISPGPCSPDEAGVSLQIVTELAGEIPILGVCLGHQAIVQGCGGRVIRSGGPMHGRSSECTHEETPIFADVPNPFIAGRYHSLIAEKLTLPENLTVSARASDGTIMAVEHREYPMVGFQFHPESILTEHGYVMLANFLKLAGIDVSRKLAEIK